MEEREPARKTIELINGINKHCAEEHTNIMLMNQKMDNIEKTQQEILSKLNCMDEKMDARYAPIIAWTILKWIGAMAGASIVGSLLHLILKH